MTLLASPKRKIASSAKPNKVFSSHLTGQSANIPVQAGLTPVKIYLVAYNLISAVLWLNILITTIRAVVESTPAFIPSSVPGVLNKLFGSKHLPAPLSFASSFLSRLSGNYDFGNLGWWTKWTQTLAVLEVVHSAVGWVRSPVPTTLAQVASRVWTVWGVVEAEPSVSQMLSRSDESSR